MDIQVGKRYILRNGAMVIVTVNEHGELCSEGGNLSWFANGAFYPTQKSKFDIVEEYEEEPQPESPQAFEDRTYQYRHDYYLKKREYSFEEVVEAVMDEKGCGEPIGHIETVSEEVRVLKKYCARLTKLVVAKLDITEEEFQELFDHDFEEYEG